MDYAIRYQEAVALPSIETVTVAELVSMCSCVMVSKNVLTDVVSPVILIVVQFVCRYIYVFNTAGHVPLQTYVFRTAQRKY